MNVGTNVLATGTPKWSCMLWSVVSLLSGISIGFHVYSTTPSGGSGLSYGATGRPPRLYSPGEMNTTHRQFVVTEVPWWNIESDKALYVTPCATNIALMMETVASALELGARENLNVTFEQTDPLFDIFTWTMLFSEPALAIRPSFAKIHVASSEMPDCTDQAFLDKLRDQNSASSDLKHRSCAYRCPAEGQTEGDATPDLKIIRPSLLVSNVIRDHMEKHQWNQFHTVGVYVNTQNNGVDSAEWTAVRDKVAARMKELGNQEPQPDSKPTRFYLAVEDPEKRKELSKSVKADLIIPCVKTEKVVHYAKSAYASALDMYLLAECDEIIGSEQHIFAKAAQGLKSVRQSVQQ